MTALDEPTAVVRRNRPSRKAKRRGRALTAIGVVLAVAVIGAAAWWGWGQLAGSGGDSSSDSVAASATTAVPTTTTTTTTTTIPTTTVPDVIVAPLQLKGNPLPVVFRIGTFDPVAFITIDDGITQDPALIQFIKDNNLPITMFLTERYATGAGVDYFKQLQAEGATVEAHSVTHANLKGKSLDFQTREVCQPVDTYAVDYGVRPKYFRPPYGNYDANTLTAAASCGLKAVVWWSATFDKGQLALQEQPLRRGEIILMHFNDHLIDDLKILLAQLDAAGLKPAQLTDYLDAAPIE